MAIRQVPPKKPGITDALRNFDKIQKDKAEQQKNEATDVEARILSLLEANDSVAVMNFENDVRGRNFVLLLEESMRSRIDAGTLKIDDANLIRLLKAVGGSDADLPRFLALKGTESKLVYHPLGLGEKTKAEAVTGQEASDNQIEKSKEMIKGKTGSATSKNEFSGQNKARKILVSWLQELGIGQKIAEKLAKKPELKDAVDAMQPHLREIAGKTLEQIRKDPEMMKKLKGLMGLIGQPGFQEALKLSLQDVGAAVTAASGLPAVHAGNLMKVVELFHSTADKLSLPVKALKLPLVKGLMGASKEALHHSATVLESKFLAAGLKAGTTAGTAGKVLPVVGNALSLVSMMQAGIGFIGRLFEEPRDARKILNEGVNVFTQGIGMVFPWVAFGGAVLKKGGDAYIRRADEKKSENGEVAKPLMTHQDVLPHVNKMAELMRTILQESDKAGALSWIDATEREKVVSELQRLESQAHVLAKEENPKEEQVVELGQRAKSVFLAFAGFVRAALAAVRKGSPQKGGNHKDADDKDAPSA